MASITSVSKATNPNRSPYKLKPINLVSRVRIILPTMNTIIASTTIE